MGRFAAVWTREQRAAVVRACVDDKLTAPAAMKLAHAGELYGLEPFQIPLSTVRDYARKERRQRERAAPKMKELDGAKAAEQLRRRVLVMADAILDDAEHKRRRKKLAAEEFERVARTVLKIAENVEGKLQSRAPDAPAQSNGQGGFLDTLAAAKPARAQKDTAPAVP